MELAKIEINDFGGASIAEHNMPCAICRDEHAVYNMGLGIFSPCWDCQKFGWRTKNLTHWGLWKRIIGYFKGD